MFYIQGNFLPVSTIINQATHLQQTLAQKKYFYSRREKWGSQSRIIRPKKTGTQQDTPHPITACLPSGTQPELSGLQKGQVIYGGLNENSFHKLSLNA